MISTGQLILVLSQLLSPLVLGLELLKFRFDAAFVKNPSSVVFKFQSIIMCVRTCMCMYGFTGLLAPPK